MTNHGYAPDTVSPPGETLEETLDALKMLQGSRLTHEEIGLLWAKLLAP